MAYSRLLFKCFRAMLGPMKQPDTILEIGTRIITHTELSAFRYDNPNPYRCPNKPGRIASSRGDDVYEVLHDDGINAPYCCEEFELAPIGRLPLEIGTRVITNAKLGALDNPYRCANTLGKIESCIGGDVYRVLHNDGMSALYYFDEFELAPIGPETSIEVPIEPGFYKYGAPEDVAGSIQLQGGVWIGMNIAGPRTRYEHTEMIQLATRNGWLFAKYIEPDWPPEVAPELSAFDPEFLKDFVASAREAAKKGAIGAFVLYFGDDTQAHTFGEIDERDLVHALERSKLEALSEES